MYTLESPRWGDSKENTLNMFMLKKFYPIMPPYLALLLTLISSNYPCLKLIFIVPKVFEPLKFDCISKLFLTKIALSQGHGS